MLTTPMTSVRLPNSSVRVCSFQCESVRVKAVIVSNQKLPWTNTEV